MRNNHNLAHRLAGLQHAESSLQLRDAVCSRRIDRAHRFLGHQFRHIVQETLHELQAVRSHLGQIDRGEANVVLMPCNIATYVGVNTLDNGLCQGPETADQSELSDKDCF